MNAAKEKEDGAAADNKRKIKFQIRTRPNSGTEKGSDGGH
jgi:hypothetical protein